MAAAAPFRIVAERTLFAVRDYTTFSLDRGYAVSPDDRSFLFVRQKPGAASQLIVVLNWFEELKAKVR